MFECLDSSGGQLGKDATLQSLSNLDFGRINPVSGPVYVEGAQPGDALESDNPPLRAVGPRLDRKYSRLRPARRPVQRPGAAYLVL